MNKNIAILRGPIGPLMMEASRVADDVQIMFDALSEAKLLLDSGRAGEANRRISVALMAVDRK